MEFETIADVYAANDKIRENFMHVVSELSEEQENLPSENGKWTLAAVVEHVAKVENGMLQICRKLLSKSETENKTSDGSVKLSKAFIDGVIKLRTENQKVEAPEMVHPEGGIPIADSLKKMEQNRAELNKLKPLFENFDGTLNTFPHPAFGEINAHDWLVLIGGHETRHAAQIGRILEQEND